MTTQEQAPEAQEGASRHLYPASAMIGDYLRAAAGLVPTGAIFATMPVAPVPATLLGGFAIVFGIFGLRTALRHNTSIEMTDTEIRAHGLSQWLIERTIALGRTRPPAAVLFFDPPRPQERLDAARTGRRRHQAEPRQPHRRVRRGRAPRRRCGRMNVIAGQRIDRRQSRSAGGQGARMADRAPLSDLLRVEDLHVQFATPAGRDPGGQRGQLPACARRRRWPWSASPARASRC